MLEKTALHLATLGPVGRLPSMPGTWGSLASVMVAPWLFMPASFALRAMILVSVLALGSWAATQAEKSLGAKDPGCVVIDELFGQWLTLLPFSILTPWQLLAGFALFRLFDILKPWPIKKAETAFSRGFGVMIDDGVAGVFAGLVLFFLLPYIP